MSVPLTNAHLHLHPLNMPPSPECMARGLARTHRVVFSQSRPVKCLKMARKIATSESGCAAEEGGNHGVAAQDGGQ